MRGPDSQNALLKSVTVAVLRHYARFPYGESHSLDHAQGVWDSAGEFTQRSAREEWHANFHFLRHIVDALNHLSDLAASGKTMTPFNTLRDYRRWLSDIMCAPGREL